MGEDYLCLLNYLTIGNNEELFTLSQLHLWITKQAYEKLPHISTKYSFHVLMIQFYNLL